MLVVHYAGVVYNTNPVTAGCSMAHACKDSLSVRSTTSSLLSADASHLVYLFHFLAMHFLWTRSVDITGIFTQCFRKITFYPPRDLFFAAFSCPHRLVECVAA